MRRGVETSNTDWTAFRTKSKVLKGGGCQMLSAEMLSQVQLRLSTWQVGTPKVLDTGM